MEQEEDRTKTLRSDRQTKGMRSMRINSARIAVFVIALSTFCVHAEILQYSIDVDNGGSNYSAGSSGTFELTQFNPSQGTLESVLVEITGNSIGGWNKWDNESSNTGELEINLGAEITVTGPGTLTVISFPKEEKTQALSADSDGSADFAGTDFVGIDQPNTTDVKSGSPDNFASYIGTGSVSYNFESVASTGVDMLGGLGFLDFFPDGIDQKNAMFNFSAVVTYTYTVIPEPATGLILVAGAGMLMIRRRFSLC
jgi:hypothetical protein